MNKALSFITATGLGAGLMYVLDPDIGKRRRALARDKVVHGWHKTSDAIDTTSRDMKNRTFGIIARTNSMLCNDGVSDEVLVERLRSKIGRYVSHPSAVEVSADNGNVTLQGAAFLAEVPNLISVVERMRGVRSVRSLLEVHESAENVSDLQELFEQPGERFELLQERWSPAARFVVGLTGGLLATYGIRHGGALGGAAGVLGAGMIARGLLQNSPARCQTHPSVGPKPIEESQSRSGEGGKNEPRLDLASTETVTETT